jgi:hypothetical protein
VTTFPIFHEENGQRIAINPSRVVSIVEITPGRVTINLPDAGIVLVAMTLEAVIARLEGGELPEQTPSRLTPK